MNDLNCNNQDIEITALYFRSTPNKQQLESYPRRMVWGGREYSFVESGMHYLVRKGQQLVKLFDVSDGSNSYRLRLEGNRWTLVSMKASI
jgi:hypothetical protein